METKEYIAKKIFELRKARGLNQEQLGNMLLHPMKKATISSWEKGRTKPDGESMLDLCEVFNVDISEFYPPKDGITKVALSDDERELLTYYRKLSVKGKHAVLAGLKDFAEQQ